MKIVCGIYNHRAYSSSAGYRCLADIQMCSYHQITIFGQQIAPIYRCIRIIKKPRRTIKPQYLVKWYPGLVSLLFSFLRRNFAIFIFSATWTLTDAPKPTKEKSSVAIFSCCHEQQSCQFLFFNSRKPWRKNVFLCRKYISIRCVGK